MARQTRQQRRARREGDETTGIEPAPKVGSRTARSRARQQQVRPGAAPAKQQTGRREPVQRGRFIRESYGELKKVDWPGQKQVTQGTIVVLIACAIVGAYLYGADVIFERLVKNVFLGQ